jgi:hypothetical protein
MYARYGDSQAQYAEKSKRYLDLEIHTAGRFAHLGSLVVASNVIGRRRTEPVERGTWN